MSISRRNPESAQRRADHHLAQIRDSGTKPVRLRRVCLRLVAEALRGDTRDRIDEITNAILDLTYRVQKNLPLPDPAPGSPTVEDLNNPRPPPLPEGTSPHDQRHRTRRAARTGRRADQDPDRR